jgi:hypothetical protein
VSTIADLIIKLGVSDSGVSSAFDRTHRSASKLGGALAEVGKVAVLAAGAAGIGALAVTLKTGYSEWTDSTKVAAQTAATLKSTGNAANVTAKHVDELSSSLLAKSGVDDEAIKSGENMLLTFTGVRNEVGKGNDVFDRATKAVLDMDTAMTHGNSTAESLSKTSILVGKALNDPVKGATALRRVGVSLTEAQQKQIAAFVKSGDTMAAQKLILGELTKEFGGSAEAMGKTLPGQIKILRENFNNLAGDLFTKLVPALTSVLTWVSAHWPQISAVFGAVFGALGFAIHNGVIPALTFLVDKGREVVSWFQAHWGEISAKAEQVFKEIEPKALATFNTLKSIVQGAVTVILTLWDHFGSTILATARNAFQAIEALVKGAMQVIQGVVNVIGGLIHGDWARVWKGVQEIFSGVWTVITGVLRAELSEVRVLISSAMSTLVSILKAAGPAALSAAKAIGEGIWRGIKAGVARLVALGAELVAKVESAIRAATAAAAQAALDVGRAIVRGVLDGVGGLGSALKSKVEGMLGSVLHSIDIPGFSPPDHAASEAIGQPLGRGVIEGFLLGSAQLPAKISEKLRTALEAAKTQIDAARSAFSTSFGGLTSVVDQAFDAISNTAKTKSEKLLDKIVSAHDAEAFKANLASAKAAVADARGALAAFNSDPTQGGTLSPEEAAQKQSELGAAVVAAAKQVDDLLYQQKVTGLQTRAAAERLDLDATLALRKQHMDAALQALSAHLVKERATAGDATKETLKLLGSYGIDFKAVGANMGKAWIQGLKEALSSASKGAGKLSGTIAKAADDIPGFASGVRNFGGGLAVVGERGPELVNLPGGADVHTNAETRGMLGGGSAQDGDVVLMVDGQVLGRVARKELDRTGKRNVALAFGTS